MQNLKPKPTMKYALALLLFVLAPTTVVTQSVKLFSSDQDLSNSMITSIVQDGNGFLWIATEDGLNRFDGLNFKIYRNIANNPHSLTSNFIRSLFVDSQGRLWVGTINGLLKYNYQKANFDEVIMIRDTTRLHPHVTSIIELSDGNLLAATSGQGIIRIDKQKMRGEADLSLIARLSSEFLEVIFEDFYGRLWIGTENEGLNVFNPATNEMRTYRFENNKPGSISSNYITAIIEDHQRNILIGTANRGLNRFIEGQNAFQLVPTSPGTTTNLPIRSLFADRSNNIWVGTSGVGLWKLPSNATSLLPHMVSHLRFDLARSRIHSITKDREGNLWLGVFLKGAAMIPGRTNNFNTLSYQQFADNGIGSGSIMSIAQDRQNQIWVGTDTDGIYQVNLRNNDIWHFPIPSGRNGGMPVSITSLVFDAKGVLWAGSGIEGFFSFEPNTRQSRFFRHNPFETNSLSNDKVQTLLADREGYLWIGTSGGGLNRFDPETGIFTRYLHNPGNQNTLCNNWVNEIYQDSEGLIWIGTYNRVSVLNPQTGTFRTLSTANGLLPNNIVYFIAEDADGKIWIGTNEGIAVYDKTTNTSEFFTTKNGLSNNVITAILHDEIGDVWISTHGGISRLKRADNSFTHYFVHDGLQGNEFRRNSALQSTTGELLFGGINGLTWFVPSKIIRDTQVPPVHITDLILLNQSVQIGERINRRIILTRSIEHTDTLRLPWANNNFSIEFSTIGFTNPERFTYQYRLLGFDNNWINTGTGNRRATFTNIEPGTYIFQVRAVDGANFSEIREMKIRIMQPWWNAWWFRLLYMAFFMGIAFGIYKQVKTRLRQKQEYMILENQEKINEAKLQFYTNISHEIRTPLTLIAGPLEKLLSENSEPSNKKNLQLMAVNTQRLIRLVNQLLDVRKIDKGQLLITYSQTDLVKFISGIMEAFHYIAEKKDIRFHFSKPFQELHVWIDPNNFDKVIYNVLYNAFKFTPKGGEIEIHLRTTKNMHNEGFLKEYAEITISDTGPGIESENLQKIFDRFYKGSDQGESNPGTGIGLHLARTLVEMQHGRIFARNRTSRSGSVFYIQMPLGHNHIANAQITHATSMHTVLEKNDASINMIDGTSEQLNELEETLSTESKTRKKTTYKVLIADDDAHMRQYLRLELEGFFKVLECANGKDALDIVHNSAPDLILTDVVMPIMDGVSLCRKLKSNPATSHLPVVLITSRAHNEDLVKALDVGADAYFIKPFKTELLKKNIYNLLINRERIKIRYSPEANVVMEEKPVASADQALLNKIIMIIESRLADPQLGAEDLSREIGMSRVHLFRKLKKITGQSPSDFIRNIRLQKAAQLLEGKKGFIKEIAFEVGFTSLSYFSKCFHEFYGMKPSEYTRDTIANKEAHQKTP
ncbi:MAG TPA: hybrid sensor histidine kinase/response regulator [Bacteroidales bacterium]|nr:hybrid sensor histidine kinase/response regulator [Bacteroidales bacterium]